ncbi:MAG: hypothetical protein WBM14_11195 [Terracidiphilus sp.]|jgi:hypothetical protein
MGRRTEALLREALANALVVRFGNPYDEGSTHGYVLDIGPRFFLLGLIGEDIRFNGFQCFRLEDVRRLQVPDPYADFIVAALRKRSQQIRKRPNVDLSSLSELLKSANCIFPLVTIHRECAKPDACWIGRVLDVTKSHVLMHEIGPDAFWDEKPSRYLLNQITRVEFGGDYEEALHLVGGKLKRPKKPIRSKKI